MNGYGGNIASGLLVALVVLVVFFLICRELFCWYWKINQNIALLTEIRDLLTGKAALVVASPSAGDVNEVVVKSVAPRASSPPAVAAPAGPLGTCPNCSTAVPLAAQECPKCKASFGVGSAWKVQPR